MDNLKLWESVEKTDPRHTKKVNQRGGFTAIDAHYQIKCATEAFGPVGIGWGFVVEKMEVIDPLVVVHVSIWHGDRDNAFGPILGCAQMLGQRTDADAPKKATTDAITKGLSYLGFNADVFMGKFDDNKYLQEVAQHFAPKPKYSEMQSALIEAIKARKIDGRKWMQDQGIQSMQEVSDDTCADFMTALASGTYDD